MAPPGRRRFAWSLPSIVLTLILLLSYVTSASAASAVLGIDVGTEYLKAALVKPGIPLEIVLTKDSKRKESASLAFKKSYIETGDSESFPERLYGSDAVALAARFPEDVYSNLKALLGLSFEGDAEGVVGAFKERYPGLSVVKAGTDGRDTLAFDSENFRTRKTDGEAFLVEELLAMKLKNVRDNAEALAGSTVEDAVITIPPFYSAAEKRSLELAAELAGIRVLGLISDGLAVGVNYATSRTFSSISEGGKPEYHVIYDMGAGSTSATVLKFQGRTVKDVGKYNKTIQEVQVVGIAWDKTLGGDALNQLIVDDMVAKLVEHKKIKALGATSSDIKKHGKTMAKLWKDSERLRQILSANSETQSSFEGIYHEDVTFKYKITRAQYEELASQYAARVQTPLLRALEDAKLSKGDIESIILHGGLVRTPFVQKNLEVAAGASSKIRTNVNSDEAAVFGAAFKAAGLSPSFRVKDIRTSDTPGFAVGVKWQVEGKDRHQKLFTPSSQIATEKSVPIKTLEDVTLEFYQQIPSGDETVESLVSKVETQNLTASVSQLKDKYGCGASNITTQFTIRLSPIDGLPEVVQGSVSCEIESKSGSVVDDVKGFFGFGSKKSEQEPLKDESSDSTETVATESASSTSTSSSKATSSSAAEKASKDDGKARTVSINVSLKSSPLGLPPPSPAQLRRIKDRLSAFDASDRSRVLREEALNTLEAFTYRARDLLTNDDFIDSSTDAIRATLEEKLEAASDWLYGDGAEAPREELKNRLKELRELVDPILRRRDEASQRPDSVKRLQEALDQTKSILESVKKQIKSDEVASASASSAASSAKASPSKSPEASTEEDDLDDDSYGGSDSSATTTSASPTPSSLYTSEDLELISTAYDTVSEWFKEKTAAQSKLTATDDPAFTAADIEFKANELNQAVIKLVSKRMKAPPKDNSKKTKDSKKKSSKDKKKAEKEKAKKEPVVAEEVNADGGSDRTRDEL